jgi:hypothetical protein
MNKSMSCLLVLSGLVAFFLQVAGAAETTPDNTQKSPTSLDVAPAQFELRGARAKQPLIVTGSFGAGGASDITRQATYETLSPFVALVTADGLVVPRGDGAATIVVRHGQLESRVEVTVTGFSDPDPVNFRTDAIAALGKAGCNQGACHGSPQGKNGFRLSLRGFNPDLDFLTLTHESSARRTNSLAPETSLLLLKGSAQVPHQGGVRFRPADSAYRTLRNWIAEGCRDAGVPRKVVRLEVLPEHRRLHESNPSQQLIARAHFDDGSIRDVTDLAVFSTSNADDTTVTNDGLVKFERTGETTVLVRYLDRFSSSRLSYIHHDPKFAFQGPAEVNYVDHLVFAKQRELQLLPAEVVADEVFLRRVYLDCIGVLPTVAESREFLASKDPARRAKLIDTLLERDEFASFWALKWADLMRGSRVTISDRGVHSFHRYLLRQFAEDRPFDQFVRETLTSRGNTLHKPAANFFRVARSPEEMAESMSQLFLGVRIQCAKCHNHPFESITQGDYHSLAAFFARVKFKGKQFGLDDEIVYLDRQSEVKDPVTNKPLVPRAFETSAADLSPEDDRRSRLADWVVKTDNPFFAASTVNRIWYHLLGQGIVEPVDDFRQTNPPSNPDLLRSLADDFVREGYRIKPIVRRILNSHTYQLSSQARSTQSPFAADAQRYFTHATVRMLTAEQILDAISQATGVPELFSGHPAGTRAIELPEGEVDNAFLTAFAKPVRDVGCECAREDEPSLTQVMQLINNGGILSKLKSPQGNLSRWLAEGKQPAELIELIYLATLSRRPTPAEVDLVSKHIGSVKDTAEGIRDLEHALINSNEFLLRH